MSNNMSCPGVPVNNSTKSSQDCRHPESQSLSPLTIGLVLEPAIILVVFGNLLVLISLRCHRNLIVTDILLFSLSLADFVDGLVPLQMIIFMNYFLQRPWTKALCDSYVVVVNTLRFASAGTVTAIAIERTFLIVFPLKYHTSVTNSKAKKLVALIWLISVFFGALPFIGVGHSGFRNDTECHYQLSDLGIEYAVILISLSFLLLLTVLSCYVAIKLSGLKFIRRQSDMVEKLATDASKLALVMGMGKKRRSSHPTPARRRSQGVREVQRLTIMMAIVIAFYYISWLPLLINNIVTLIRGEDSPFALVVSTGMVSLLYALFNPFIYGKMNTRYRRGYQHVVGSILGLCGCRPQSWRIVKTSQSTATIGNRSRAESNVTNGKHRISVTTQQADAALNATTHARQGTTTDHQNAAENATFERDSSSANANVIIDNGECSESRTNSDDQSVCDTYL